MKVAIYLRVSSRQQAEQELSIPAQREAIQRFVESKGWVIVSEYVDEAKSAKSDDRPEFQKVIALAKRPNRPFDAIVVHKFDRFARRREDHIIYKALLQRLDVKVVSATEQTDPETPHGFLLEGMLEVISEFYNVNLAAEVRKGMTQNAKQGYSNGGNPPYGYRTEHVAVSSQRTRAVWVLGPREEIDLIRWIFNQYAYENVGYKAIAAALNGKDVPTTKGGKWAASTVRAILFNEAYIGRRLWNKQDYQTPGKKWKDRSEWIVAENAHPPIIPKDLYDRCQEIAKKRCGGGGQYHSPFTLRANSPFWLRGMMWCDKCGSKMVGNSSSSRKPNGGHKYYVCSGSLRHGKEFCKHTGWRKERVEEIVTNRLRNFLLQLSLDNNLVEEIQCYHREKNSHSLSRLATLDVEIEFLQKRIHSLEEDIQRGSTKAYYEDLLKEMQTELADKEEEQTNLLKIVEVTPVPEDTLDSIRYDIKALIRLLDNEAASPQMLNQLVSKFVHKIYIQRETKLLHMIFSLKSGDTSTLEKTVVSDY